jgi:hypothetical protein
MKKIVLASLLFTAVSFSFTSCLKDKGFEDFEYGINDPDTQPPGVGFPAGSRPKTDIGVDITSDPQVTNDLFVVNLFSGNPAGSDITVTLSDNTTALLAAYNAANNTNIEPLPTNVYNVPSTLVIPAGQRFAQVPLTVLNTTSLDPAVQYAIGITITDVTGGLRIATNLDDMFIVFGVKNQYDGRYNAKGKFYHPSYPFYPFNTTVEMHTTGPNSVKMYFPPFDDYLNPFATAPNGTGLTGFDFQDPDFNVNPTTNKVTSVVNVSVGGTVVYGMGLGFDNAGYDSRWDPATQTFYVCYGYNLAAGGGFILGTSRMWIDTLRRLGPR